MTAEEPKTFEEATARLDELVKNMESGQMPLDQMIAAFEEGRKLVAFCNEKLKDVQRRVEVIKKAEEGQTPIVEPFQAK